MEVLFRLTVGDDRIELERGACSIVLDRTAAMPSDYVVAANVAGNKALHDLLLSMAPASEVAECVEEAPLERHIRQLEAVTGGNAEIKFDQESGIIERLDGVNVEYLDAIRRNTMSMPIADLSVRITLQRLTNQAKATRVKMGDSQATVAAAIGVDQKAISIMETGNGKMAKQTAIDIARRVISHYSSAANEKPLPTRFGTVLRAARKAKHLTTDGLGEQVGLSRNYILKIEKDPFNGAPRATVEKIADFLGVKNVDRFYREQREAA